MNHPSLTRRTHPPALVTASVVATVLLASLMNPNGVVSAAGDAAAIRSLPDWSGSWRRQKPEVPYFYFKHDPPPFTPDAKLKIDQVTSDLVTGADLSARGLYCQPFSYVGDNGGLLDTFEFLFSRDRVTLINEMGLVRRIFIGRALPPSVPETNAGYSVGHWEGSTLVVETIGMDSDARFPVEQFTGAPAVGRGARTTEHIQLLSSDVLSIDTVMVAPQLFVSPYHTRFTYMRDRQHVPAGISFCVHEDRSFDATTGHQRLDLTPPADLPPPPNQ